MLHPNRSDIHISSVQFQLKEENALLNPTPTSTPRWRWKNLFKKRVPSMPPSTVQKVMPPSLDDWQRLQGGWTHNSFHQIR